MTQMLLYIIIINNNRRDDTLSCLESLWRNDLKNFQVILLDNDSTDGSIEAIREGYAEVQIIPLKDNLGYAGNNNVGIKAALEQGADWVLILNEDTVLDTACISSLMKAVKDNPAVGIAGPMVYHFDEPDIIQSAGGILGKYWDSIHLGKDEVDQGQFQSVHQVEWISGCAILVRRDVIEQAGMFDPNYFLYWEETEWCIRARKAGWEIVHVPQAKLWHKGVQRNYQPKPLFTYYGTRNRLLTLGKHSAPFSVKLHAWLQLWRTLISWTVRPKWRHKNEHRDAMWMGMIDYLLGRFGSGSYRTTYSK